MDTWFTSDLHFGHARIAEFCPQRQEWFGMDGPGDVQRMNEMLVKVWNETVAPDDHVWFLGDLAMGQIDTSLGYVARLNGKIDAVLGNHDRPHPSYSRTPEKQAAWAQRYQDAGIDHLYMSSGITIDGEYVHMSHFPYEGDSEGEDRYPEYRPVDKGGVLIHGHIHDMWQTRGRMINVGFDAWGRLLHESEIEDLVLDIRSRLV